MRKKLSRREIYPSKIRGCKCENMLEENPYRWENRMRQRSEQMNPNVMTQLGQQNDTFVSIEMLLCMFAAVRQGVDIHCNSLGHSRLGLHRPSDPNRGLTGYDVPSPSVVPIGTIGKKEQVRTHIQKRISPAFPFILIFSAGETRQGYRYKDEEKEKPRTYGRNLGVAQPVNISEPKNTSIHGYISTKPSRS